MMVTAVVEVLANAVVTTRPLGRFKPIEESNVEVRPVDVSGLPSDYIADPEAVLGKRTRRLLDANTVLRPDLVESQPIVKRGDRVRIIFESAGMRITAVGEVKQKGCMGERIPVVNLDSNKVIQARGGGHADGQNRFEAVACVAPLAEERTRMMKSTLRAVGTAGFAVFWVAALIGCATYPTATAPVAPAPPAPETVSAHRPDYQENSLWQASNGLSGLFLDTKARNIGDIVTIEIAESSKATNKANTTTGRDSSLSAGIDSLFGIENWWQDKVLRALGTDMPKVNPFGAASVAGSMSSDFKGDGTTSRSGDLTAFITCRVTEVLPNGNLRIVGTREIMVNHENQVIVLSGVIRPRDINDQNIIASRFIADAKIAYSGSGIIDDRQRPGWMANILNVVWPF